MGYSHDTALVSFAAPRPRWDNAPLMEAESQTPRSTRFRLGKSEFWSGDLTGHFRFHDFPDAQGRTYRPILAGSGDGRADDIGGCGSRKKASHHHARDLRCACRARRTVGFNAASDPVSPETQQLSIVVLLLYVRIVLLVMFREDPVTWSRMQGGVSAYLLLGLAWAYAFQLTELLHSGSFRFVTPPVNADQLSGKLIYLSFTTLTTVGFGDVTPVLPFARSLTIAEAVVGQLFPAILIGALVSMAIQGRTRS